ncbi:hypothetical protein EW026_g5745 [Hermanssonia centrifuga]|uniref:Uncharacterized protein n=1 Tax=Hermanssonia centrifuga TaxID=98765 RepID=A0A4S4KHK1_9APHY|nr:hypothetical protein EW026_g5745 [Hermanssonia centrifuga]
MAIDARNHRKQAPARRRRDRPRTPRMYRVARMLVPWIGASFALAVGMWLGGDRKQTTVVEHHYNYTFNFDFVDRSWCPDRT